MLMVKKRVCLSQFGQHRTTAIDVATSRPYCPLMRTSSGNFEFSRKWQLLQRPCLRGSWCRISSDGSACSFVLGRHCIACERSMWFLSVGFLSLFTRACILLAE
mmetsp:Transcript_12452/g.34297  ORF Transcript_12452/g.34297 Transcript_12452/m.34297 type:complete len:104 (-) Transcript_12452:69-380(-)